MKPKDQAAQPRKVLANPCPWCGSLHDRASGMLDAIGNKPKRGDVALCIDCGEWATYDRRSGRGALTRRKPTDDEFAQIGPDYRCQRIRAAWIKATARHKEAAE